jgi:hypothetical protein
LAISKQIFIFQSLLFIKKIIFSSSLGLPILLHSKFTRAAAIISSLWMPSALMAFLLLFLNFCFSSIFISLHPHNYFSDFDFGEEESWI